MKRVAFHLEQHARGVRDPDERDKFARSSFNRYYYATFLTIRSTLAQINPKWSEPPHKEVPNLLRVTVLRTIRERAKQSLISQGLSERLVSNASTAASALASLIEEGMETRVVADYQPELQAEFKGTVIVLNGVKSSTAANWPRKAEQSCGIILNVARKFGIC